MNALVLLVGVLAAVTQARAPSAREVLDSSRLLTEPEIATILGLSQEALEGKVFSLPWIGHKNGGAHIVMGLRGQPRIIQSAGELQGGIVGGVVNADGTSHHAPPIRWRGPYIRITDFTGRPAVRCGESTPHGELVVEYVLEPPANQWNVTARAHQEGEPVGGPGLSPIFEMLQGALTLSSGDRRRVNGRWARAFVSSWSPAQPTVGEAAPLVGDPIPNLKGEPIVTQGLQTLWIDVRNLRPLRWEVAPGDSQSYGFEFKYGGRAPRPPAGVAAPDCIQSRSHLLVSMSRALAALKGLRYQARAIRAHKNRQQAWPAGD